MSANVEPELFKCSTCEVLKPEEAFQKCQKNSANGWKGEHTAVCQVCTKHAKVRREAKKRSREQDSNREEHSKTKGHSKVISFMLQLLAVESQVRHLDLKH